MISGLPCRRTIVARGSPRPQPEGHRRLRPHSAAGGGDGGVRLRQEQPGLRHPLRRGPAPLRGEPLRLRPAVPGADGEAGPRLPRRHLPGHRHPAAERPPATPARRSPPPPRSTTTCGCSSRAWAARVCDACGERGRSATPPESAADRLLGLPDGARRPGRLPRGGGRHAARRTSSTGCRSAASAGCCGRGDGDRLEALGSPGDLGRRALLVLVDRAGRRTPRSVRASWTRWRPPSRKGPARPWRVVVGGPTLRFSEALRVRPLRAGPSRSRSRASSRSTTPSARAPTCHGFGNLIEVDQDLVVPDKSQDAWPRARSSPGTSPTTAALQAELQRFARRRGHPAGRALGAASPRTHRRLVLEGDEEFHGRASASSAGWRPRSTRSRSASS